ncbi:unnamed protein product [Adineta ricciae]|uniref:Uncharacterized protein n=1 Tax=Adineta ricciae TaxID=249248 RepID=A0A814Z652_ADIRI|nr:unnamed protein product [Adineta ricciae]
MFAPKSFVNLFTYSTGYDSFPYALTTGDLNNDNRLDIIIANFGTNEIHLVFFNSSNTIQETLIISTGVNSHPSSVAVADFNSDGFVDIAVSNYDNRLDAIVVSNDTGSIELLKGYFAGFPSYATHDVKYNSTTVAVNDLNHDGILDMIVLSRASNMMMISLGYGNGSFQSPTFYSTSSNPYSLAIGDFNNDTNIDIVVANRNSHNICVYLGNDDGTLGTPSNYSTGSEPAFVALGDFNNDDRLDIVVANFGNNSVSVFLGYGNGRFTNETRYSSGSKPICVATSDFNNDNQADLVLANFNNRSMTILFGYNNGSFGNPTVYRTGTNPYFVTVADLNNDGRVDIVVANSVSSTVSVLLGSTNGTFVTQVTYGVGTFPAWVVIDDINNDTWLDLIVGCANVPNLYTVYGHGNGSFDTAVSYYTNSLSYSVAVADLNNDKRLDLVVTNSYSTYIAVLVQPSTGALVDDLKYASGGGSKLQSMITCDLNNDSRLDMIVANYGTDDISILFGSDNTTFRNRLTITMELNSAPASVAVGYFNNDSQLDIAVALSGFHQVGILLGDDRGSFSRQNTYQTPSESPPAVISAGDFNNDEQSEIVAGYAYSDVINILTIFNSGSFVNPQTYAVDLRPRCVVLEDINYDSYADMMVVNYDSDTLSVFLGTGNGSFRYSSTYSVKSLALSVVVGDFNNDDRLDLVVTSGGTNDIILYLGLGNGFFEDPKAITIGYNSRTAAVGDLDNDTNLDIVIGSDSKLLVVLRGNGDGSFTSQIIYLNSSYPSDIHITDFNNDTRLDIAVANYAVNNVGIFLGYGNGSFMPQVTYSVDVGPVSLAVGDLNNDGRLDIVATTVGYRSVSILLGNGNASFRNVIRYSVGILPQSVVIGDFNNDGYSDIVVANLGSNSLGILLGYGDGEFIPQLTQQTGSAPISIAASDLNKDAKLDIVVANSGDNTVTVWFGQPDLIFIIETELSIGNTSQPPSFVIEDFNHDTYDDIIIANADYNHIGVFLGYGNFSFANQITYSTGPSSSPNAIATGDFNHDGHFDVVTVNSLSNTIGIFFGDGNGSFSSNQTTYSTGPSSNPSSLAVDYFNHDANLDIIIVSYDNNKFGVFLGRGDGTFDNMMPYSMSYGSHPFSVVTGNFGQDGKVDFAVANQGTDSLSIYVQTC